MREARYAGTKTWLRLTPNTARGFYTRSPIACGCAFHPRAIGDPRGRLLVRATTPARDLSRNVKNYCSDFTPAVVITFDHLAISSARNLPACSGVLPTGSMPSESKRPLMSLAEIAFATSADMRLPMSRGVPAGARNKTQVEDSSAGPPASAMVGTSGAEVMRLFENIASALILPPRTCGISVLGTSTRIWMLPPIRSCSAGAVPLYGTCTMSTPAVCLNNSVVRCAAAPTPEDPNESLPGLALA